MKQIKVLANGGITCQGGSFAKGEVAPVSDRDADYLISNGYAEAYIPEVNKVKISKPGKGKK